MMRLAVLLLALVAGATVTQARTNNDHVRRLLQDLAAAAPAPSSEASETRTLKPFTAISLCAPINVLVTPSKDDSYSAVVMGEPEARAALHTTVVGNELRVELVGPVQTDQVLGVTVSLPPKALAMLTHNGLGADLFVDGHFVTPTLAAQTAFGAGRLFVSGLEAGTLTLSLSGVGDVAIDGTLGQVAATVAGSSGGLYLRGPTTAVTLQATGIVDVHIEAGNTTAAGGAQTPAPLAITGSMAGIGSVYYTGSAATCQVTSPFSIFLPVCVPVANFALPLAHATWSCGLNVTGSFACSPAGSAFLASSTGLSVVSGAAGTTPASGATAGTITRGSNTLAVPTSGQISNVGSSGGGTFSQQLGVAPSGESSNAAAAAQGSGSVSSTAVAGPGQSSTSTTINGETVSNQVGGGASPAAAPVAPPVVAAPVMPVSAPAPAPLAAAGTGTAVDVASAYAASTASATSFSGVAQADDGSEAAFEGPTVSGALAGLVRTGNNALGPAPGPEGTEPDVLVGVRTYGDLAGAGTARSISCAATDSSLPFSWH